jgi:hypothetical protein
MKLEKFKQIIQEAVRSAVREELNEILNSNKQSITESIDFEGHVNGNDEDPRQLLASRMVSTFGLPNNSQPIALKTKGPISKADNPWADFINDAANSMTPQEKALMNTHNMK